MNLNENVISEKNIYSGKVFDVNLEQVKLPNGNIADREIVQHNGGVCVVPIDGNHVYMVRQFRKGVNEVLLEFPAGKLEKGENPHDAGLRELEEETGYTADEYTFVCSVYPTAAYCSEEIHIFIADKLHKTAQNLDEDEFLSVERVEFTHLLTMVESGQIKDAKTVIGTYKLKEYLNK